MRNSLAHFRPLKYDDIELIKQNVKHAFIGIEQCLSEMTHTNQVVPTNTGDAWYKSLSNIGSDRCKIGLLQDKSEQWVRVGINYSSSALGHARGNEFQSFQATRLISPAIIKNFPVIMSNCTFVTENIQAANVSKTPAEVIKRTSIIFSKDAVMRQHEEIAAQLKDALSKIETETELVQKDNLARGLLINSVHLWATLRKEKDRQWWSLETDNLKCEFRENDPTEYWGELGLYVNDFIAGSSRYPWMPSDISKEENPFE